MLERSRLGVAFRMIGEDATLAGLQGVPVARHKVLAAGIAGALAAIGGGLYAHLTTYVEPRIFDVMLGVHSLAYGLIGGLGTAFGPLLGVLVDIGLLESIRALAGYRMIIFGGLVALLLIVRPRGLLDERLVHRIGRGFRCMVDSAKRSLLGPAAKPE
jgi:branched-chain amino acid transport system permease protein